MACATGGQAVCGAYGSRCPDAVRVGVEQQPHGLQTLVIGNSCVQRQALFLRGAARHARVDRRSRRAEPPHSRPLCCRTPTPCLCCLSASRSHANGLLRQTHARGRCHSRPTPTTAPTTALRCPRIPCRERRATTLRKRRRRRLACAAPRGRLLMLCQRSGRRGSCPPGPCSQARKALQIPAMQSHFIGPQTRKPTARRANSYNSLREAFVPRVRSCEFVRCSSAPPKSQTWPPSTWRPPPWLPPTPPPPP